MESQLYFSGVYMIQSKSGSVPEQLSSVSRERRAQKQRRVGGHFLKGPVPLAWLCPAARMEGKVLHVAIALQFMAGVCKGGEFRMTHGLLERFGVERKAGNRALRLLENFGLVAVKRRPGCCPVVTILKLETDPPIDKLCEGSRQVGEATADTVN